MLMWPETRDSKYTETLKQRVTKWVWLLGVHSSSCITAYLVYCLLYFPVRAAIMFSRIPLVFIVFLFFHPEHAVCHVYIIDYLFISEGYQTM